MARHPQPRELAEAKGATRHDPQRYRNQPPKVDQPLGTAPAYLSPAAKACWFEIESLAPLKVLTGADRVSLELLANLLAQFRDDPVAFPANKMTHMVGCLARFGMTPMDRQKLGAEKQPDRAGTYDSF
jgi:phage terminase small subunit